MPVHQHVLNWLYSVLTSEYHDVNRTYNDVAQTLTRYPSLAPRTDVHTFPDGTSALLLHLSGTIPVNFRGSTYRFPLSVWVPHAYPRQPPLIYVTPTDTMRVRPGQHVDPQGQVYHPYLVGWVEFWDKSTLFDFLAILSDVFAKEPPVVSRQQPQSVQSPQPQAEAPPPVPPPPPRISEQASSQAQNRPPPPPPKTHHGEVERNAALSLSPPPSQSPPAQRHPSRYDSAPPLPPQAQPQGPAPGPHSQSRSPQEQLRYQPNSPPSRPSYSALAQPNTGPPPPPPLEQQRQYPAPEYRHNPPPQTAYGQWDPSQAQGRPPPGPWNPAAQQHPAQPIQAAPPPPPPNLLDEPLTLDLPSQDVAPPPIPPNPEKDALLVQLAQTLASLRQQSRQQNESSMAGLQAQRHAMLSVMPTLQSEMSQLTQLSNVLTSNATILRQATVNADTVIEGSRSHPAPDIDELLVAPTVVSNQLYALVAEERALGDAIFMLGRAVERGRIPPAVFAKMTRSLAREWYLKKALVRKIGIGMGLASS